MAKNTIRALMVSTLMILASVAGIPSVANATPVDVGTPNLQIAPPLGSSFWDVVEGPDHRLYVSDTVQYRIYVYPLDATSTSVPIATFTVRDSTDGWTAKPYDLFFDDAGNLWVTTGPDTGVLSVDATDLLDVTGVHTAFADAAAYFVGSESFGVTVHGNYLYASAQTTHLIDVIDLTTQSLYARVYSTQMIRPTGVSVVGDQLIVVDNTDSVLNNGSVFSFALSDIEGQGSTTSPVDLTLEPTAWIAGDKTGLSSSDYVVSDCAKSLIVSNYTDDFGAGSLSVFAAGSTGNVEPTAIAMANDMFASEGVSIDSQYRVWVATTSDVGLLRFDSLATNCAPELPNTGRTESASWAGATSAVVLAAAGILLVRIRRRSI